MRSPLLSRYSASPCLEAGCDEAGRGCLAGPVYAAAVILPDDFYDPRIRDSKKLSATQRDELRTVIQDNALAWAVGIVSPQEIDDINILNAAILAMHRALDGLQLTPEFILVDGNRFKPYRPTAAPLLSEPVPHATIVKGDDRYLSIAAASILAKTYRDEEMLRLSQLHPEYAWEHNMGYPTAAHRAAIAEYGATPHHRLSFKLLKEVKSVD